MKVLKIGFKQFNIEAFKGMSKVNFIKLGYGDESEYEKLEPFIKVDSKKSSK